MTATTEAWLAAIRTDGTAMADAARLGLDAEVPSCPGWTVGTLLNHTGRVQRWAAATVASGQLGAFPPRPDEVTPEWFEEGVAELCGTLQAADPDAEVPNHMGGPPQAVFWFRRMANETAVHRWDTESAHSVTTPIDPTVAVGGIAEFLDVVVPRTLAQNTDASLGGSLHLHATDVEGDGEWVVRIDDGSITVDREHGKADLAMRGTASDLMLLLWGRLDPDNAVFERFGDAALFDRWRQLAAAP